MRMMFKKLKYPSYAELTKKILKNPDCALCACLEFILNCMIIDEFNEIREDASCLSIDKRKKYEYKSRSKRTFKLMQGEIELVIPRFSDFSFEPKALKIAQSLHEKFQRETAQDYISGASDRDIGLDSIVDGDSISRTTASRYYQGEMEPEIISFLTRDLEERDYIDLQVDAMYTKVCEPALPHPKYANQAQIRVIGLSKDQLNWENLVLSVMPSESVISYQLTFEDLINRRIGDVYVVTTDFHKSFLAAITSTLIGVETQGCRFHHQKDITRHVDKDLQLKIEDLFKDVYDKTFTPEDALSAFENALEQYEFSQDILERFENRFLRTLTYKEYPYELAKEISTTNMAERCNEEERRRLDPRHLSPNDLSLLRLAVSIANKEQEDWFDKEAATAHEAYLSQIIHDQQLDLLYNAIQKSISKYPQFSSNSLENTEFTALWCNLFVLPVTLNNRTMTIGFIAVFGIDNKKKSTLLSLSALKSYKEYEISETLETLKVRNLDLNQIQLVVQNTNVNPFIAALEQTFESSKVYTDPNAVLERALYLTPEDFKSQVSERFQKIYQSDSYGQAAQALENLNNFLIQQHLFKTLALITAQESSSLLNGFILVDNKTWSSVGIEDFQVRKNWSRKLKELRNNPLDPEQTVKELVKVLKRKQYTKLPLLI